MDKFCGGTAFCEDGITDLVKAANAWTIHNYIEEGDTDGLHHKAAVVFGLRAALQVGDFLGLRAEMQKMLVDAGYELPNKED